MTIFVDASAKLALLLREPEEARFERALQQDNDRIWSAISRWEAIVSLVRTHSFAMKQAVDDVDELAGKLGFRMVPISDQEAQLAAEAFEKYGKGRHPADLNMGDCFAYACAKANQAQLLYKGNDFAQTDLA